ncbi:hypothetical protein CGCF415_v013042 [Colletotrichum fructicola]|nr:hypothetical protein CGCF415_v013042 [Colletotrichum fructicola]KAF4897759.1 hypothetical protein CGCFRS4_v004879 [Colletotrichum fructicola]KAF4927542.1 hypothetical protein CGCF245_v013100 [Colletotrichum fructicola]
MPTLIGKDVFSQCRVIVRIFNLFEEDKNVGALLCRWIFLSYLDSHIRGRFARYARASLMHLFITLPQAE